MRENRFLKVDSGFTHGLALGFVIEKAKFKFDGLKFILGIIIFVVGSVNL